MAITFNESYYLQTNPDVALAVSLRQFASGADHFNKLGANELRNPNAVFDSKYYAAQNPDVLTAVSAKTYASVYAHYLANGMKEGRAPNASLKGFDGADYLVKNPDVATAGFTAATALQHYVQYGVDENRSFTSSTAGAVVGNVSGTTGDDTITPAGGQTNAIRVEGGQQGAAGDTLVITSGSASSFQVIDLSNTVGDQNRTLDAQNVKVGPVVQGFENVDARQATINMTLTGMNRDTITNTGSVASTQTGSVLQGGTGRDTINGGGGNDVLSGNDGSDQITANAGNDTVSGGAGDDVIAGNAGNDTITDGAGNDTVTGDAGTDTITVEAGINSIDGGADNDTINVTVDQATSTTVSTIGGGAGDDTISLNATAITAASRASVSGGSGNDTITAGLGVETINAGAGNDTVKFTSANLGTTDVFNGNDGQDILQLEIPTGAGAGSGATAFTFTPSVANQFTGFEAIALIDSSGNTSAKSYKIVLTDTFLANNFINGSFLIDARGLPGGSNVVIDFSALTAASAARFTAGAFRVLTSPSTDVRDQNNVGIINSYTVSTGNALLPATAAFTVYAGDNTITAGTAGAYNTDRTVNTGAGQATYLTSGGTVESGTTVTADFTLTSNTAILTSAFNSGATLSNVTPTTGTLTTSSNSINAGTNLLANTVTVADASTTDTDTLSALLTSANGTPSITNIETINLNSFGTAALAFNSVTGMKNLNITGQSFSGTGLTAGTALTIGLNDLVAGGTISLTAAAAGAATLTVNNSSTNLTLGTYTSATIAATGTNALSALSANTYTVTGSGSLALSSALVANVNASAYTGTFSYAQTAAVSASVTGTAGNDTFTFSQFFDTADTITGGAGTDTLVLAGTGNVTANLDLVTGVENITLGTGGNYVLSLTNGTVAHAQDNTLVTINASALTTETLSFTGTNSSQHAYVVTGGAAADTILGSALADTITGGNGADVITGNAGNDSIILTETTAAVDTVTLSAAATNGNDSVTGFTRGATSGDIINFADLGTAGTLAAAEVRLQANTGAIATAIGSVSNGQATDSFIILNNTTYATGALAEAASNVVGAAGTAVTGNAAVYFLYTDGTNGYIAYDSDYDTDGTTLVNVVTLVGVNSTTALNELVLANFSSVA
jgi:Ca2+-binding RTX toxin-like protein